MHGKYLVTGVHGMLGTALLNCLQSQNESVTGTDLPDVDLTDPSAIERLFDQAQPTHVINPAAYTDVNGAESNKEICEAANVTAPRMVAQACARHGVEMLHISTDYVFDGNASRPYRADDPVGPISAYGWSKLRGELAVQEVLSNFLIVRTAWLFGSGKRTFVSAILDALKKDGPVKVVEDEIGSPTYAVDLAKGLIEISRIGATGVFHLVNSGQCSRYEMSRAIAEFAGYDPQRIVPIRSADWVSPAARPLWSVLDCSSTYAAGVTPLRDWKGAVNEFVSLSTAANRAIPFSAVPGVAGEPKMENCTP